MSPFGASAEILLNRSRFAGQALAERYVLAYGERDAIR